MADPKTSVSDYQRGRSTAFQEVVDAGMAIYKDERNDLQDRRAIRTFVDRFTRETKYAELCNDPL